LLRLPYVCFVTLNYDVMLDRRLQGHHPLLSTFDDYISKDKNWSLVKLHGSVNWYHPLPTPYVPEMPPRDVQVDTSQFRCASHLTQRSSMSVTRTRRARRTGIPRLHCRRVPTTGSSCPTSTACS
jgi:hypothetical protein